MSDTATRALERAAAQGDQAAADRLAVARLRAAGPEAVVRAKLAPVVEGQARAGRQHAAGWLEAQVRGALRVALGVPRLPSGSGAVAAGIVEELRRLEDEAALAGQEERARAGEAARLDRAERLRRSAVACGSREGLAAVLERVQVRARERLLDVEDLVALVERVRRDGEGGAEADHDVARAYSRNWRVSFTLADGVRAADGAVVLSVWRSGGAAARAVVVIASDLVLAEVSVGGYVARGESVVTRADWRDLNAIERDEVVRRVRAAHGEAAGVVVGDVRLTVIRRDRHGCHVEGYLARRVLA